MLVKMRTTFASPLGTFQAGRTVDIPSNVAEKLIRDGYADAISAKPVSETAKAALEGTETREEKPRKKSKKE